MFSTQEFDPTSSFQEIELLYSELYQLYPFEDIPFNAHVIQRCSHCTHHQRQFHSPPLHMARATFCSTFTPLFTVKLITVILSRAVTRRGQAHMCKNIAFFHLSKFQNGRYASGKAREGCKCNAKHF